MDKFIYPWKRRWIPRDHDASENLSDTWVTDFFYTGFSAFSSYEIEDLLDIPCLILLGEPGMGKSFIMRNLQTRLISDEGNHYCFINLADYESNADLHEALFGDNPDFQQWRSGTFRLHLFLDSLDEARIQIKAVTERLIAYLQNVPDIRSRLSLRIACRTADWPFEQETRLKQLWNENDTQAFVLAPLQYEDVLLALQIREVEETQFRDEIRLKGVETFCSRPITFNLLLDEYCRTGKLPNTRHELYRRGCEALCRETKSTHAKEDSLQPEQRFLIAARIAAIMVFTGHLSIQPNSSTVNENGVLNIGAFTGEQNRIDGLLKEYVYEADVIETLGTALFRGGDKRKWVHQTYAEFLAGWYAFHTLQTSQIRSFLFHPSGRVIPQLRETAAWIAASNAEITALILDSDPEILLRSDVAVGDYGSRNQLAQALLQRADTDPRFRTDWSRIKLLMNPALASTVSPYLEDGGRSIGARRFAILCADECEIIEVQDALLKIALNPEEPIVLRDASVEAIARIGSDDSKAQIRAIALAPLSTHDSGDLKFEAIRCVWPKLMNAEELFQALDTNDTEDVIDYYNTTDWGKLILPHLSIVDIPIALKWIQKQRQSSELPSVFADLFNEILGLAWQHLDVSDIATAFAQAAMVLWLRHDGISNEHGFRRTNRNGQEDNPLTQQNVYRYSDQRHILLQHLIPLAARVNQDVAWNFISDVPFLRFPDAPLLIAYFNTTQSSDEKRLITSLLHRIINLRDPAEFEFIYEIGQRNPELWTALNYQLSIELNSKEAADAKERYAQIRQREKEQEEFEEQLAQQNQPISPSPTERVQEQLIQIAEGDIDAWWLISKWMMYLPNGRYSLYHQVSPKFDELPVWETLNDTEKELILERADAFLNSYDCESLDWRANWKIIYYPIVAGYRAFFISCTHNGISKLNFELLSKWVPALVSHVYQWVTATGDEKPNPKEFLMKLLYIGDPAKTIETLIWLAGKEDEGGEHFLPAHISHLWDERLSLAFLGEIQANRFSAQLTHSVLKQIATHSYHLIDNLLREWVMLTAESSPEYLDRAYNAATLLLLHAEDVGWPVLWPIFYADMEFGKEAILRTAREDRYRASIVSKLTEKEVAEFYVWLHKCFPPANDPERKTSYTVTREHEVAIFRDLVLQNLMSRGTEECIYSLRYIQQTLGEDFAWQISQAEDIWRNSTWQPLSIQEIRTLINDQRKRWIQNGSQLLDVIVELLVNLSDDLQGRSHGTPSAIDLWNESKADRKTVYTPKDENRLSDYVERYLRRSLIDENIFISREAQIRRGSLTDIYIETRELNENGAAGAPLVVVVEVKGCWHPELSVAMENQLQRRYLTGNGFKYGLYLVGRFMCDNWDRSDNRWATSARNTTIEEMQKRFSQQAKELSVDGVDIRAFVLDARL